MDEDFERQRSNEGANDSLWSTVKEAQEDKDPAWDGAIGTISRSTRMQVGQEDDPLQLHQVRSPG